MNISIVIPNYNGKNLLEKNLPKVIDALKNYKNGFWEIIIVDDCSIDESVSFIENFKSQASSLKLIINEKNMGFSSTVNKGVSAATGEIIILLNTDVYPQNDFLNPLLSHFKDLKVFAVGCMDKSIEGDKTILRGRGLGSWQRGFLVHKKGEVDKKNTLWVSAGSGAFRKSIWDKLGGLNTLYNPFYYEDIDLSYRALKSGYKVVFAPESVVIHEHEKGSIKSQYSDTSIKRIAYRNQFIFVWENATDLGLKCQHAVWLLPHFLKAIGRMDKQFILGFFDALILLPKVIKSSLSYHRFFVKKDSQVISELK